MASEKWRPFCHGLNALNDCFPLMYNDYNPRGGQRSLFAGTKHNWGRNLAGCKINLPLISLQLNTFQQLFSFTASWYHNRHAG